MIRFDNEILNDVCEEVLSAEENRLKLACGDIESFPIGVDDQGIGLLENRRWRLIEALRAVDRALLISRLAQELGAHLIEGADGD